MRKPADVLMALEPVTTGLLWDPRTLKIHGNRTSGGETIVVRFVWKRLAETAGESVTWW